MNYGLPAKALNALIDIQKILLSPPQETKAGGSSTERIRESEARSRPSQTMRAARTSNHQWNRYCQRGGKW